MFERFRRENHGVRRVELLEQNIGLIALTLLPPAVLAAEKMTAAMTLVQDTDALIIDLRENRGGSPDGVTFFASYFFKDGETRLSDVIEGPSGEPRQFWTLDYVPGKRYLDRPVYALTSAATFSGGEAFAYDLKALGRATVIGEQTRGGAHPSSMVSLAEHVELRLPTARSVNPHTDANWEGVGVEPDVPVPASEALDAAIAAARTGARRGLA
jgi:C-terminal processing protease CtpA/Prc